jgi:type IV secretory pathway VirB2 component (pilin)
MDLVYRWTIGSRFGALFAIAAAFSLRLQAAAAGGLPWEKPMTAIATSLTGAGGLRHRFDRDRDCRGRNVVGR